MDADAGGLLAHPRSARVIANVMQSGISLTLSENLAFRHLPPQAMAAEVSVAECRVFSLT
jgi:hypothetical protein